jgi:hypothetical protein
MGRRTANSDPFRLLETTMAKKSARAVIRQAVARINARTPTLTVTCDIRHRLTRPKGFPGAYIPWQASEGFIWQQADDVKVSGPSVDALVAAVRAAAERLAKAGGEDLEAVKIEASLDISGVRVRFDVLLETKEGTQS